MAVACLATYFGQAALSCYNNFAPDFLGKVVHGGDPAAPPGTTSREAYDVGVSQGAIGILILYLASVCVNLLQSKLLERIGELV